MKKMIYKYLMILIILIMAMIYIITSKYELLDTVSTQIVNNEYKQDGSQLTEVKDSICVSELVQTNTKAPLDVMYKVEDEKANLYSLSYKENKLNIGSMLTLKKENRYISDQLYLIFRETYPNVSLKDMGLNSVEEAYQATQLAIWEIAARTGEAEEYNELSFIDSIKEDMGLKNININVFRKAKELVSFVENYSYDDNEQIQLVPSLSIDSDNMKNQVISKENDILIGPFTYNVQTGILTNVEIEITDQDGNEIGGQVVDVNGFEIDYMEQKSFYIKVPKSCDKVKFNIKAEIKKLTPTIYEDENSDYVANTYTYSTLEKEFEFYINKK